MSDLRFRLLFCPPFSTTHYLINYFISWQNGEGGDFHSKTAESGTLEQAPITLDCTFSGPSTNFLSKVPKLSESLMGNMHFLGETFPVTCIHIGKVGWYKYKSHHQHSCGGFKANSKDPAKPETFEWKICKSRKYEIKDYEIWYHWYYQSIASNCLFLFDYFVFNSFQTLVSLVCSLVSHLVVHSFRFAFLWVDVYQIMTYSQSLYL